MPRDRNDWPLDFRNPEDFGRLREVLSHNGFTDRGVAQALGISDARSISGRDLPLLLDATRESNPLNVLIRLFLMGVAAGVEVVRRAIAPMTLEEWAEAGLVRTDGAEVAAEFQLLPFDGLWLAFDQPRRIETGPAANYVMGIGSSSLTLANLTVRRPSSLTLDLGTGCGFQAFVAAPHSRRVVAADRNPRAVHLAQFNARLNELTNVECLEGNLFEPVEGRQFDLVVSNPPFVISPETSYIYRDSGLKGDEISQRIARQVSRFLCDEGYCQILCNWAHLAGQRWQDRLASWFRGTGCDAWAMCSDTLDAAAYAAKWIRHTERDSQEQFRERFDRWMQYYRREGIEAVSGGLITMRRRAQGARNWFRADDAPEKMLGPAGEAIAIGFELRDFLEAAADPAALLDRRLRLSPEARLSQHFRPSAEGWQMADSELSLARGLAYSGHIDPYVAGLLARCNGAHTLGELVHDLAASLETDAARILPTCLDVVRRLIERGFLLPAGDPPTSGASEKPDSTVAPD